MGLEESTVSEVGCLAYFFLFILGSLVLDTFLSYTLFVRDIIHHMRSRGYLYEL